MSIIGGNCKGHIPCCILAACSLAVQFACAMPSEMEIRRVQPMVLELMSPHEKNFDAKKETAKEVGDAAVSLAEKAEGEAAKYVLLKGAIHYYALAKEYDLAADALESIRAAVKDFPDDEVASIASKALSRAGTDEAQRLKAICRVALMRSGAVADVKTFRSALRKDPDDKAALRGLADAYVRLGDWKKALKAFSKLGVKAAAFELDPAANKDFDTLKAADFWWSCRAQEPAPYRAHAAVLYKAAMGEGLVKGLRMPLVEKRIAEAEALVGAVAAPVQYGIGQGMQFTAQMAGSTIKLEAVGTPDAVTLEYSLGKGGTYSAYTVGNTITLANAGDEVWFRAASGVTNAFGNISRNYHKFVMTGLFNVKGDISFLISQGGGLSNVQKISSLFKGANVLDFSLTGTMTMTTATSFLNGSTTLKRLSVPGLTATTDWWTLSDGFRGCRNLETVDLSGLEDVSARGLNNGFEGCSSLKTVKLNKLSQTNTESLKNCFKDCTSLEVVDMSEATAVPAISSGTFQNNNNTFKVVVPDALYSTWIKTGNWAHPSIVGHIIKKSDWDALQNN